MMNMKRAAFGLLLAFLADGALAQDTLLGLTQAQVQLYRDMQAMIKVHALAGPYLFICDPKRERCVIPVVVGFDTGGACYARIDQGTIWVFAAKNPKKTKTRVVWLLVNADVNDPNDYRFDPGNGIAFDAKTPNDPQYDFAGQGQDSKDSRAYRWVSVNGRGAGTTTTFQYAPTVQYYDKSIDVWKGCNGGDPTIANFN